MQTPLHVLDLAILAITLGLLLSTVLRPGLRLTALAPPNARTVIIPRPGQSSRGRWPRGSLRRRRAAIVLCT